MILEDQSGNCAGNKDGSCKCKFRENYLNLPKALGLQYNGYSSQMILCNDIKISTNKCYTANKKSHYNELLQKYKEKPEDKFL
jgi:deoxyadenosine/deoxycytidine kinase